jgi:enamine deaminase RidA (YjgF/YER057c/UK114 family)
MTFPVPLSMDDWSQILEPLLAKGATIFHADLFGGPASLAAMHGELRRLEILAPQTAVLSASESHGGMQIGAISGAAATPVFHEGRLVGGIFEDADSKYCMLGDVRPSDTSAPRERQAEEVFQIIEDALADAGMRFRDVVRTWFYNDRILDWYDAFNHVRTGFFQRNGIVRMPASTGVGAANPAGAALVAKAVAVLPKTGAVTVRPVESPLQCDAFAYGSAFSRAMEVATPRARTIYVSGTASIEPGGLTAHVGNTARQIETTLEVVAALLAHAGMDIADTTRAIAYFRHAEDMRLWAEHCRARQLPALPVIVTQCDICRDDLLFEIELDAARPVRPVRSAL